MRYVSYKKDTGLFSSWFDLYYGRVPSSLDLVLIADSARTIIAAMEQGLGAGIIVSHLVADKLDEGSLVAINPGSDRLTNTIACVTLRNKKLSLAEKSFQNHFAMKIAGQSNLIIHN